MRTVSRKSPGAIAVVATCFGLAMVASSPAQAQAQAKDRAQVRVPVDMGATAGSYPPTGGC